MGSDRHSIIVGAAKSATSSLCYNFKYCDEVLISVPKETNYFNRTSESDLSLADYQRFWDEEQDRDDCVYLEATPAYTFSDSRNTAKKISLMLPNAKLVYIMRDPIERLVSHFNFNVNRLHWNYKGNMLNEELMDVSNYRKHIESYLTYFDRSQLLLLNQFDLLRNPKETLNKVLSFLEIEGEYSPAKYRKIAVTKNISRMDHWDWHYRFRRLGSLHSIVFNSKMRLFLGLDKTLPFRKLSTEEELFLGEKFQPQLSWLKREMKFDCSDWYTNHIAP